MANSAQPVCVLALQRRNKSELGPLRTLWGAPATQLPSLIDRPLPSTARVQEVFATRMLMGLAVPAELQRRSA